MSDPFRLHIASYNNYGRYRSSIEAIKKNLIEQIQSGTTRIEITISDHEIMTNLKSDYDKLKAELEQYKSGNLPTWRSEYEDYKAICESLDEENQKLRGSLELVKSVTDTVINPAMTRSTLDMKRALDSAYGISRKALNPEKPNE